MYGGADRRELLRLLKAIGPGNVVTVTRIDRLATAAHQVKLDWINDHGQPKVVSIRVSSMTGAGSTLKVLDFIPV